MEIRKHPAVGYGEDAYFIPKGTPEKLFPGKRSAKTLVQACKTKLQSEGLLEVLCDGATPGKRPWYASAGVTWFCEPRDAVALSP